jgi:diguanylate cyclase (GGDEF)-like protein
MATNGKPSKKPASARKPAPARRAAPARKAAPPARDTVSDACHYCRATIRADYNYCAHCGMPIDAAHDRPLFVVEGLSNLFNIVFFEALLEQELNRASRYGHDLAVIVAEIDSLSALEGALGYEQTNNLVREVGEVISNAIREPDTLASTNRVTALGTQRFLVLLPETGEEGAFRAAEKIRNLVDAHLFNLGEGNGALTLTLGVASTGIDPTADANLLGRATQALITAHGRGSNRVQVASS